MPCRPFFRFSYQFQVLILGVLAFCLAPAAQAETPEAAVACGHLIAHGGAPVKPDMESGLYFCRTGYLGYMNPDTHVADWVVELITPDRLERHVRRRGGFKPETQLPEIFQTRTGAYTGSGYVRGHLAPANDMRFSKQAMTESFYLANVAPQLGASFNGSKWKSLEGQVQRWAKARPVVIVLTGTIYGDHPKRLVTNAANDRPNKATRLLVPDGFYKIIFAPIEEKALAFRFPHESLKDRDLREFRTSVDALESETGYDFFAAYDNDKEAAFESNVESMWE